MFPIERYVVPSARRSSMVAAYELDGSKFAIITVLILCVAPDAGAATKPCRAVFAGVSVTVCGTIVVTFTILGAAIYYAPKIIDPTNPELRIFVFAELEK